MLIILAYFYLVRLMRLDGWHADMNINIVVRMYLSNMITERISPACAHVIDVVELYNLSPHT